MFQPPMFNEERMEVMHDLINQYSFGIMVGQGDAGLSVNHLPFVLHPELSEKGTLRGHISKGNPLGKKHDVNNDVTVIFQGPHHYISPGWYASKAEHGKVVPTWNYATVHAIGKMKLIEDTNWLFAQLNSLTEKHEAGYNDPWKVSDAPEKYIRGQMKGIIGIEIEIAELIGKWKMSQNKNDADKAGILNGLSKDGDENALQMIEVMKKLF